MKKVRICFEVSNMVVDENDHPAPAGIELTLGEVSDEKYAEVDYAEATRGLKALDILDALGLRHLAASQSEGDYKLISPEEYDAKYGEKAQK